MFSGVFPDLRSVANGGFCQTAFDRVWSTDPCIGSLLKWEDVFYDPTTGEVEFTVNAPSLSSSVDNVLYFAFGNAATTTDQSNRIACWDAGPYGCSLRGANNSPAAQSGCVLHFPSGSNFLYDSVYSGTPPANTDAIQGGLFPVAVNASAVYGRSAYLQPGSFLDLSNERLGTWQAANGECWVRKLSIPTSDNVWICDPRPAPGGPNTNQFLWGIQQNTGLPVAFVAPYTAPTGLLTGPVSICDGNWHHLFTQTQTVAFGGGGSLFQFYVDGVLVGSVTNDQNFPGNSFLGHIGVNTVGAGAQDFYIDEFRIGGDPPGYYLPASWVKTSYNNGNQVAFFTIEKSVGPCFQPSSPLSLACPPS